ncbi:MAG: carboxylating nicotinate-nucleotide diphosphorylase [Bacteroidales bacterium]|nr:carboxylating nicotinate-nucleotide diphosphorylase [Bacteroidales bacterium]
MNLPPLSIEQIIQLALREDIGNGDHTTQATIPPGFRGKMALFVKEKGIIAGVELARQIFHHINPSIAIQLLITDGKEVQKGDVVFIVEGPMQDLLLCERTTLNFMQRMSGIATLTHQMVELIKDTPAKLLDTRKTTPILRLIEKWAVRIGGGYNHRFGLDDMILIKDNHIDAAGGIRQALTRVKEYLEKNNLQIPVEIEVRNKKEIEEVLSYGYVQRILLDNFTPDQLKEAVQMINKCVETEASGGITPDNIRPYAETGVDFISSGFITHHYSSLDLSLKFVK